MPPKIAHKGTDGRPSTAKAKRKAGQTPETAGVPNSVITSNNPESSYLLVEYETQLRSAEKEIKELKLENERFKSRQAVKQDHNEVTAEHLALKTKNAELQKELEAVGEALKQAMANTGTREPAESLQTQVEKLQKEVQELKDERQTTKLEHEDSIRTLKRHHASAIDDEKKISSKVRQEMSTLNYKLKKIEAEKNAQRSISQMEGMITSLKLKETNLLKDVKDLRDKDKRHLQELEEKLEVIKGLEEKLGKLQTQLLGDQEPPDGHQKTGKNTSVHKASDFENDGITSQIASSTFEGNVGIHIPDINCGPCHKASARRCSIARWFCQRCNDYFCQDCKLVHSTMKIAEAHEPVKLQEFCAQCKRRGQKEHAEWYCTDCLEHLCEGCKATHRNFKLAANHRVVNDK